MILRFLSVIFKALWLLGVVLFIAIIIPRAVKSLICSRFEVNFWIEGQLYSDNAPAFCSPKLIPLGIIYDPSTDTRSSYEKLYDELLLKIEKIPHIDIWLTVYMFICSLSLYLYSVIKTIRRLDKVWFYLVLFTPPIGAFLYYLFGKKRREEATSYSN